MRRLPAEFEKQSFIQIIFPHKNSDWNESLEEAENNFIEIIKTITKYQECLVICDDIDYVKAKFENLDKLHFVEAKTDDTWARDCSALTVYVDDEPLLLDFKFNAWGEKFKYALDDKLTQNIASHLYITCYVSYHN